MFRFLRFSVLSAVLASPLYASTSTTTTLAIAPPVPLGSGIYQGSVLQVTATVTDSSGAVGVGTVNFCFASVTSCTPTNRLATAQVLPSGSDKGTATVRIRLGAGHRVLKAFYAGTVAESPSVSSAASVQVASRGGSPSATQISSSGTASGYTFSAQVTATGSTVPGGSVAFQDASNADYVLGSVVLSSPAVSYGFAPMNSGSAAAGASAAPPATGDFNGDGYLDIAYVSTTGVPEIFFGDGTGLFASSTTLPVSNGVAFAAGDFNADGATDLALLCSDNTLHIFMGSGTGTFTSGAVYATGVTPSRILTGDFNDDGVLDLAFTNRTDGTLSVYLGNGNGTFTTSLTHAAGPSPLDLAMGDFNGDGYGDVAVMNTGNGTISLYLGGMSGSSFTFTSVVSITLSNLTGPLVTGDFNGDGRLDLAVGMTSGVAVIPRTGTGLFNLSGYTTVGSGAVQSLVAGDLNADGMDDLLVQVGSSAMVYLGDASSLVTPLTPVNTVVLPANTATLAAGDFDGDAMRDMVALAAGGISVAPAQLQYVASVASSPIIVPGSGLHQIVAVYGGDSTYVRSISAQTPVTATPTATSTSLTSTGAGRAALGQSLTLTATVTPSVLGAEVLTGTVAFYDGATLLSSPVAPGASGVATYTIPSISSGSHSYTAVYQGVDVNFLGSTSPALVVYTSFPSATTLVSSPGSTASVSDVVTLTATVSPLEGGPAAQGGTVTFCSKTPCTGSALLGSAQVNSATSQATLKVHLGTGSYSLYAIYAGTLVISGSTSANVPLQVSRPTALGDGLMLTATPQTSGTLQQYLLTGTLSAMSLLPPTGQLQFVDTTNNNLALGSATLGSAQSSYTLSDGSQFVPVGNAPDAIASADVNGDGFPDIVVTNATDATVSVLLNDGLGGFAPFTTLSVGGYPYAVTVGDFNNDGHSDIAVANALGNSVSILIGDGTGHFTPTGTPFSAGFTPTAIVTADYNLDGNPDLAVANYFDNAVSILYGDGHGNFTDGGSLNLSSSVAPLTLATADLDGDGIADLVVPDDSGTINIYLGTVHGLPAVPTYTVAVGGNPLSLAIADLNGDGKPDLVYVDYTANAVHVIYGDGTGAFAAAPTSTVLGSTPTALNIADVNSDGLLDIEVATSSPNQMVVIPNLGTSFAPAKTFAIGGSVVAMASGDFAMDGGAGFATAWSGQTSVDIARVSYALTDAESIGPLTVYGGGTHKVQVTYAGDTNFAEAQSVLVSVQGNLIPSAVAVGLAQPVVIGSQVVMTATVTPSLVDNYVPSGTVSFSINGVAKCTNVPLSASGTASCTTAAPGAGTYTFGESYSGDANFEPAEQTIPVVVPKVTPVITWPTPAAITYGTAISATQLDATESPNIPGNFSYSVTPGQIPEPGTTVMTVTFIPTDGADYNTASAQVSLLVNPVTPTLQWPTPAAITYGTALSATQLNASLSSTPAIPGTFSYTPASGAVLAAGTQNLAVTFTPTDTMHYAVAHGSVSLVVNKAPLTVTANSIGINLGQAIPALTYAMTGFVHADTQATATTGAPALTLTPPAPAGAGAYPITAAVGTLSASNYTFSFVDGTLTIAQGTVGLVLNAPASENLGSPITLTATLSSAVAVAPGGTITFRDGATTVGTATVSGVGAYTATVSLTPAGSHTLTAVYSGDTNYVTQPSNTQTVNVVAPAYSLSTNRPTLTLLPGQTGLITLTMTPVGGFNGTVSVACTGLPGWASCAFNPAAMVADGSGSLVTSQMVITTLGSSSGTVSSLREPGPGTGLVLAVAGIPGLLLGLMLTGRKRKAMRNLMRLGLALLAVTTLTMFTGCGSSTLNCCSVPDASAGSYQIQITGSNASGGTQTTSFTLTVQ